MQLRHKSLRTREIPFNLRILIAVIAVTSIIVSTLTIHIVSYINTDIETNNAQTGSNGASYIVLSGPVSGHGTSITKKKLEGSTRSANPYLPVKGMIVPLKEAHNDETRSKISPGTNHLIPNTKNCDTKPRVDRYDHQCSNEVYEAAKDHHSKTQRKSSPASKSTLTESQMASRYYAACSDRDPSCPIEWISFMSTCTMGGNRFAKSIIGRGIPLTILGLGKFWRTRWGERIRALHDYLVHVPDERIVVWSDADDVLLSPRSTIEYILEDYYEMVRRRGGPTVFFPAEVACYPDRDLWKNYTKAEDVPNSRGTSPFRYLNAGTMIGPASHIRSLLRHVYHNDCDDDQRAFTKAFLDPVVWWREGSEFVVSSSRTDMRLAKPETNNVADPATTMPASSGDNNSTAERTYKNQMPFPPDAARVLVGLDYWNEVTAALYNQKPRDIIYGPEGITIPSTKGTPHIIHQNGEKVQNRVLELLAMTWNLYYDKAAIESMKTKELL